MNPYNSEQNPYPISLSGVTQSTWTTLNASVPAGATGVKLQLLGNVSGSSSWIRGVRMNGSFDVYVTSNSSSYNEFLGDPVVTEWNIGVDSSGNFQYWTNSTSPTEGTLYVAGYYGPGAVFLTNAVSLGAMSGAYAVYSASAAIPSNGIAGFFFITGGDNSSFLRVNGSTDNYPTFAASLMRHWLVGCDSSQNISGIAASSARTLYCQGYMTQGYTAHINAANVTPATAGSFQNVAQAGGDTGTITANQYYFTSNNQTIQLAGQGATTILPVQYPTDLETGIYSAYAPSKANLGSVTNGTLLELGYFTASPVQNLTLPQYVPNPVAVSLTGIVQSTWFTGIASGAPPGATGMQVLLVPSSGLFVREFRATGSTDNYVSDACGSGVQLVRWCGLNSAGQFDFYSSSTAPAAEQIFPLAYFGPGATFPQEIVAMPSTLGTAFTTFSTGGAVPAGVVAAVFAVHGGSDYFAYFRHPASQDNFANDNEGETRRDFFCALNASQQYAAKAFNAGVQPYLVAYFTAANVVAYVTAVPRTPTVTGVYQPLSISGDPGAIGVLYYTFAVSGAGAFQISGQGSTWSAPDLPTGGGDAGPTAAAAPPQINAASANLTLQEQGYVFILPIGGGPSPVNIYEMQ